MKYLNTYQIKYITGDTLSPNLKEQLEQAPRVIVVTADCMTQAIQWGAIALKRKQTKGRLEIISVEKITEGVIIFEPGDDGSPLADEHGGGFYKATHRVVDNLEQHLSEIDDNNVEHDGERIMLNLLISQTKAMRP